MFVVDEKHWMKAGIEYNDNQSAISSVVTNGASDWGTGEVFFFYSGFVPKMVPYCCANDVCSLASKLNEIGT